MFRSFIRAIIRFFSFQKEVVVAPTPARKTYKRLTPVEWQEAAAAWRAGNCTLQSLSDKYGITKPSLSEGFARLKVTKGADLKTTSIAEITQPAPPEKVRKKRRKETSLRMTPKRKRLAINLLGKGRNMQQIADATGATQKRLRQFFHENGVAANG